MGLGTNDDLKALTQWRQVDKHTEQNYTELKMFLHLPIILFFFYNDETVLIKDANVISDKAMRI